MKFLSLSTRNSDSVSIKLNSNRKLISSFIFCLCVSSCFGQFTTNSDKVQATKGDNPVALSNLQAQSVAQTMISNIFQVNDLSSFSYSTSIENFKQVDQYHIVNIQKQGNAFYFAHVYQDGRLKYALKVFADHKANIDLANINECQTLAEKELIRLIGSLSKQYSTTSVVGEKTTGNIIPYIIVSFDRNTELNTASKVPKTIVMKINPKTNELMSLEYLY